MPTEPMNNWKDDFDKKFTYKPFTVRHWDRRIFVRDNPWLVKHVKDYISELLSQVERDAIQRAAVKEINNFLDMLEEKPGEAGWSREFNERLVEEMRTKRDKLLEECK